jgi:hypothetical protein
MGEDRFGVFQNEKEIHSLAHGAQETRFSPERR